MACEWASAKNLRMRRKTNGEYVDNIIYLHEFITNRYIVNDNSLCKQRDTTIKKLAIRRADV